MSKCQNHQLFMQRHGVTTGTLAPICRHQATHLVLLNQGLSDESIIGVCPMHARGLAAIQGWRPSRLTPAEAAELELRYG